MTKRDDGIYDVQVDMIDEKLSIGDMTNTFYQGKEVIYVKPIEDEDPYWNRWAGSDMKIIIG